MDTTVADALVGEVLDGRYRIESRIARGGMATVYVATDLRLERTVALKVMHAELAHDEDFVRRFIGEAKSVAQLSHPGIAAVYDQGSDGQHLYLAMEYVPGRTLRELLRERGRMNPGQALDMLMPVLAALGAAHAHGIVHRDVKPENVLITVDGRVKVVDFGLARAVAAAGQTRAGIIIGTVAYLSPEQVARSVSDARSDVYSAGVMLFEMLTGGQPHRADTPLAVAYKHVNEIVPPPSSVAPGIPPVLDTIVALATSRDPDLRPADANQFLQAVVQARQSLGGATTGAFAVPGSPGTTATLGPGPLPAAEPTLHELLPPVTAAPSPLVAHRPVNQTLIVNRDAASGSTHRRSAPPGRASGLLFGRPAAYIAGALAIALVLAGLGYWMFIGRYTSVPDVKGFKVTAAEQQLRSLGFKVRVGPPRYDDHVAKDLVSGTDPATTARVLGGAVITLLPSKGPHLALIPTVSGMSPQVATQTLQGSGFTSVAPNPQPGYSDTVPSGQVMGTNPAAGTTVPVATQITLVVSQGPGMQNFVGQPFDAANQWFAEHQLVVDQSTVQSDQPAGTVVAQSPNTGPLLPPGSHVQVQISQGQQVPIPDDIKGKKAEDAQAELEALGFQVSILRIGPNDNVFNYSPTGQAQKGSTITLWVGWGNGNGNGNGGG